MGQTYCSETVVNYPRLPDDVPQSVIKGPGQIEERIGRLVRERTRRSGSVCILAFDGYLGVEWQTIMYRMEDALLSQGLRVEIINITSCYKKPEKIDQMLAPSISDDPSFGVVYRGRIENFFDRSRLALLRTKMKGYRKDKAAAPVPDVLICYGSGTAIAFLRTLYDEIFYYDVTREYLLQHSRREPIVPLGAAADSSPVHADWKQLYYVDYPVLNKHKKYVLRHMHWYVDANLTDDLKLLPRTTYDKILATLGQSPFRLKPDHCASVMGGQRMKEVRNLPKSVINCFWDSEADVVMALMIGAGDIYIEIPFYNLIWGQPLEVVGSYCHKRFPGHFPLAVGIDDMVPGDPMPMHVHPNGAYIKKHFHEAERRDESYYIIEAYPGAKTYLGFQEKANLKRFRQDVVNAEKKKAAFDCLNKYINTWHSKVGDLFLIPAGTIHGSGARQLVLEIDTEPSLVGTEYSFFIYDYLRPKLDGRLRRLQIRHAFEILKARRTKRVAQNLMPSPTVVRTGNDWCEYQLAGPQGYYFKIHRLEFTTRLEDDTRGTFHVLTLVKGKDVLIRSRECPEREFKLHYLDTIVVPACMGEYCAISVTGEICHLIKSLLK